MANSPGFLDLPERAVKPRARGITHVLDKGLTPAATDALLSQVAHLIDIVKVGWGIGYVDPTLSRRAAACAAAGVSVCLGGTLLEVAARQGRVDELRSWALSVGITHLEVSNGLCLLDPDDKLALIKELSGQFTVLAETGAKDGTRPVHARQWAEEMARDLDAGARWVVAEGRESGTVGLYRSDQSIREDVVAAVVDRVGPENLIFEAPTKAQQTWFVRALGADVSLGNVEPSAVLPLETLRLGLRADTAATTVGAFG
ncbi:phosphosulfolactate synthase [Amycolatopsis alkalitolerans]|uniref:Phosphohydrolase n=1 Tax=Amycolatopsis alkalitolerans TaxID=2547244 RepID=A0A5C4M556_9PSEU|nr:phosphosulfolactate synthase [Amycolatopsis alkalitolerans]TNC28258.1 phosphohydrolase [Amycolatopsis alkalitolerans]